MPPLSYQNFLGSPSKETTQTRISVSGSAPGGTQTKIMEFLPSVALRSWKLTGAQKFLCPLACTQLVYAVKFRQWFLLGQHYEAFGWQPFLVILSLLHNSLWSQYPMLPWERSISVRPGLVDILSRLLWAAERTGHKMPKLEEDINPSSVVYRWTKMLSISSELGEMHPRWPTSSFSGSPAQWGSSQKRMCVPSNLCCDLSLQYSE